MFKLLKELAKAPEPLAPPPSRSHGGSAGGSGYASVGEDANLTYQPRSRSGTMSGGSRPRVSNSAGPSRSASRVASRRPSFKEEKEDEVDMDEAAIRVVQLLASLRVAGGNDAGSIMRHVETFSQLLSLPGTAAARRAFRRHGGFKLVPDSFATALRHQPQKEGQAEEESQVLGVQRIEGIRLAFETIAWALGDKASEAYFQRMGGYSSLLPKLYLLSEQDPGDRTLLCPDSQVLGHLLAHIMSNDYSCLSILDSTSSSSEGTIKSTLRFGSALPLLLAYVLGAPVCFGRTTSCKDAKEAVIQQEKFMAGHLDTVSPDHQQLIATVVRALTQIASTSTTNLFTIVRHLPLLPSWLITRIYGPAPDRHFAVTFPPREGWSKADDDEPSEKLEWRGPPADLRSAYLSLLRQLLEGGVTRETTWRLFALVRKDQRPKQLGTSIHCSPASSGRSSPANGAKRKRAPTLLKLRMPSNDAAHTERLDAEVLDLLQHAMKARWPPAFLFGGAGDHGAIELKDTGRSWPKGERGLHLSAWVYISRLNAPITLFHFSQAASTHPFLLVKILENSQISIATTQHSAQTSSTPPDDIICSAPDALIPHGQWVHFALNLRHPKGGEYGEARLYVNGGRVGAMRMPYPVPIPPQPVAYAPQMGVKPGIVPETIRVSLGAVFGGATTDKNDAAGKVEDNEWSLGRVLVLEEAMAEDLVLLSHHLGPRYTGNFQEPLGKFLTYEAATSINVYLNALGRSSKDRRLFSQPATATLVRAIRTGPTIVEESILLSVSAKDVYDDSSCVNGAFPHPSRAKQLRAGTLRLVGQVTPYVETMLDETVAAVGGGTVVLKIIDLCQTPEELRAGLGMLRDLIKDNWAASEEMERFHGFELLSAILRPKMPQLVDVPCAKIILSILGIDSDQPSNATVRNSSAYRALALDFELWSTASVGVISVYLQHFASLLTISKHSRYNALRTFQKAAMVKRLLYALRSGFYDASTTSMLVDTLSIALTARWSGEDAIKPTFSYLVSSLCQTNPLMGLSSMTEPPTPQLAGSLILAALAELLKDEQRLVKLNRAIALHRLLVIFISSNSAYYVVIPCLQILHLCLSTPGLESFTRSFEGEGGYALLARTLGPIWREDIQKLVWQIMVDEESDKSALSCSAMVPSVTAAIEYLLSTALESEESKSPASGLGRSRSGTITSIRSITLSALTTTDLSASDNRLEDLLQASTKLYNESSAFRRAVSTKRVESMLPALAEFAAMSATSTKSGVREKRAAAVAWISALVAKAKSRLPNAVVDQASHFLPRKELKLVKEQLEMLAPSPVSATPGSVTPITPLSPGRGSISGAPGYFGSSVSSRLASSPGAFGGSATPRRRPSTDSMMTPIEPLKRRPSTDAGLARVKSGSSRVRIPLQRTLTGESVLEGGKDKNAAWKLIIIQTDLQAHSKMTLERKEHWKKVCQHDWPRQAAQLRGELGIWPDNDKPVLWRLDGSEGPLRMRNRLERVNDLPDMRHGRGAAKLRDAIPTADELSSAVSRLNVNPWEDPFSLALGEASITEEGKSSRVLLTDKRKADYTEPAPTLGDAMDNEQNIETPASQDQLDDESYVELEDDKDDKMRRIARTLQAGDVVEEAHNIVRIVGVDACPGLLILGRKNLYLIDGLVQTPEGEVIDARDSPRDALSIPSGTLVELDTADQQNARWSYSEIVESNKRAFLFREVALELYFADKRNFLVVFRNQRERQTVVQKLASKDEQKDAISRSVIGNYVLDQVARATDSATERLMAMSRKWQNREISNFAYLQLLNQHANRTPNDVTQYPVFPWVLTDFTSPVLDLSKDSVFRDLTLPMGALTPARREAAIERYSATEGVGEKPFHYGTHYSSSMIVCGFMIRMSPFTEIFLALQGGNFDLADRLFSSIPRAWDSASSENRGDVRELIPEFFYSAGFLRNINHHDFGITQGSNEQVDDVTLPSWALCDPLLFIHRHREALESDYVSRHLHTWIDLVFGYKQRDPASFNTYHPLSYRGAVDLDKIKDESEKASSTAIIHNFGQTPVQIFKTPHCHRLLSRHSELPMHVKFGVAEQWQLLTRSILPIAESYGRIDVIQPAYMEEARPTTQQKHRLAVPGNQMLSVQYGFTDSSLRVYYQEVTSRLVHVIEGVPTEHAVFANPTLLVTVSPLSIVTAWRLSVKHLGSKKGEVSLQREATLRGHTSEVTCIATSTAWSFVVTGCKDGTAAIWDTNRLRYVRTLVTPRKEAIKLCAVHECDGTIALASAHYLYVYSLNGYAIASAHVNEGDPFAGLPRFSFGTPHGDEDETALLNAQPEFTGGISFLNREFLKYGALFVIGIDSELALFRCVPGSRAYEDQEEGEVQPWMLIEQGRVEGSEDHAGGTCTAVKFIGETLYAGFEPDEGQKHLLYQWSLPEGNARHVQDSVAHSCMDERCVKHFGLLEPRRFCGGCGGAFCGTHALHVEMMEKRYCETCRAQLSRGSAMGLMGNRKDSAQTSSRRNSLVGGTRSRRPSASGFSSQPASRAGSRRPSFSHPASSPTAPGKTAAGVNGANHTAPAGGTRTSGRSAGFSGFAGLGF